MEQQIVNFLRGLRGDIFKLLPMKENEMKGIDNHINDYLKSLMVNLNGALSTYPQLLSQKLYLCVINNMQYILNNEIEFKLWRKIILNSTHNISTLYAEYGGIDNA